MPPSPDTPRESQVPLCVDLDGTLIKTDLLWEALYLYHRLGTKPRITACAR